jgi:nicotinamide mononucleotide transporter
MNYIELIGVILGLAYVIFEIRASVWMWPIGILTALFYVYIFFDAKFYADMSLQFYYLGVSVYGLAKWKNSSIDTEIKIRHITFKELTKYGISCILIFLFIYFILFGYTDSPLPAWDSFTTALSIIATYLLVFKIIELWWIWILVNIVSSSLYVYKGLDLTGGLYIVYTILSIYGLIEWRKKLNLQNE